MKTDNDHSYFKYLSPGQLEEKWGLYVTTVGYSKVEPNQNYPNTKHPPSHQLTWNRGRTLNDYYMIFISKGRGLFCSALTDPRDVEEGTCFFLFPGIWHRYKPDPASGWEEYWVGFHGTYADQLMQRELFRSNEPCVPIGLNKELLVLFNRMTDLVKSAYPGYAQQIAGITLEMLGIVHGISEKKQQQYNPIEKLISKAIFLMQESFEKPLNMQQLAQELPMGYSAFRKNFKAVMGQSPNQYHLQLRLERARELLESTALNINEVAEHTGFDSIYYFSKLFKKKVGCSPNAYRKDCYQSVLPSVSYA